MNKTARSIRIKISPIKLVLILIAISVVALFVFSFISNGAKGHIKNTGYNYEFILPDNKKASAGAFGNMNTSRRVEIEDASDVDLRNNGFSIEVIENPTGESFQELCKSNEYIDDNDFNGSCDYSKLETEPVILNQITWDKITSTAVPYYPEGFVRYVLSTEKYIYYVVDPVGDQDENIQEVLSSFVVTLKN